MNEHDDLFDKSAPRDPELVRLEQLLGRFGHRPRPLPQAQPRPRRAWRYLLPLVLAAAAVVVACLWWRAPGDDGFGLWRGDGARVARHTWVEAAATAEHLTMPNLGWLTLAPGSRLRLQQLDREQGHFWLEHGELEAFVYPSVRPGFFRVETAATTCVDLGCKYVLDVDPDSKRTHVRVTLGKVAFTDGDREVFVPRGAECTATPGHRVGTPRFVECPPDLRAQLDAYDSASDTPTRRAAAAAVFAVAHGPRDTLPLWHLLADADGEVRDGATAALVRLVGSAPADGTLAAWRDRLEPNWW